MLSGAFSADWFGLINIYIFKRVDFVIIAQLTKGNRHQMGANFYHQRPS